MILVRFPVLFALPAITLALSGCGIVDDAAETTALTGTVLDWNEAPVEGAEVELVIGSAPVTGRAVVGADGRYVLPGVPFAAVLDAYYRGSEVSLVIHSPREDRPPFGTVEGDRVALTPLSLDEFVADLSLLAVADEVELRTGYVPLQAPGYAITGALVADGGELTWSFASAAEGSPIAGPLEVTLIVAPGSIHLDAAEPQREITLTPIPPARAPMRIPDGGGGVIWTIQPRGVVFDPPAKVRVTGDRLALLGLVNTEVGAEFDVFGASLEQGWQRFGPARVAALDGTTVTLESRDGIISKGAWGHVFAGTTSDAGALISCYDRDSGEAIPCVVFDDNWDANSDGADDQVGWVSLDQVDYGMQHRDLYYTDLEPICAWCSNNGHPESQLALGLDLCAKDPDCDPSAPAPSAEVQTVWIKAARLDCLGLEGVTDLAERDAVITSYYPEGGPPSQLWENLEDFTSTCGVEIGVAWRNFSYQADFELDPCP